MTAAPAYERCPEFDCAECGRHIVIIAGPVPDPRLCAACMMVPGWLRDPAVRTLLDPMAAVREPDLTTVPEWRPSA